MARKGYNGNQRLRAADTKLNLTVEQVYELAKCEDDPIYFIRNYYKIIHVDHGLVQFDPYEYQIRMVTAFHENRFVINKLPRQAGKTTIVAAYLLWFVLFNEYKDIIILANKEPNAVGILRRMKLAYEHTPLWMQQGILKWDQTRIELENGSSASASATSGTAARSGSYALVYLDEFAFVSQNIAEEFFRSVYPTISSGKTSKMLITSTPQGLNMFYELWSKAVKGKNSFIPIAVDWWEHPERDDEWAKQEIENTSQESFDQEYSCVGPNTVITIRDKYTGRVETTTIGAFYEKLHHLQAHSG